MGCLTYTIIAEGVVASNFLREEIGNRGEIYSSAQGIVVVTTERGVRLIEQGLQKNPAREKIFSHIMINKPLSRLIGFYLLPQEKEKVLA